LYFTNTHIDFDDFDHGGAKKYIDETFYWELLPSLKKKANIYMRTDEA